MNYQYNEINNKLCFEYRVSQGDWPEKQRNFSRKLRDGKKNVFYYFYPKLMFTEQHFTIPKLTGISEKTIEEHIKLYAGYVKHTNLILDHITEFSNDSEKYAYELGELQRRFSFEWCGMRNHEVYFSLLEGDSSHSVREAAPTLGNAIADTWGTFENWVNRFQAIALTRGIGWAMLYYDPKTKSLVNGWVDEQHLGQLADCRIIVALDLWEHSYVADYFPSGKKQYIMDFMNQINWSVAEAYFVDAKRTD